MTNPDYHFTGSIHTVQIKAVGEFKKSDISDPDIKKCIRCMNISKDGFTDIILNPHKLLGDCLSYSDYQSTIETILSCIGVDEWHYKRVDFRLDSYELRFFESYYKAHRLLFELLALSERMNQKVESSHMSTGKRHNLWIADRWWQVSFYDKQAESRGRDPAKARLEFRLQLIPAGDSNKKLDELLMVPVSRLRNSINSVNFKKVCNLYNGSLVSSYESTNQNCTDVKSFISIHEPLLFKRSQVIELLEDLSKFDKYSNAKNKFDRLIKHIYFNFFTLAKLHSMANEIERAMADFFNGSDGFSDFLA